MDNKKWTVIGVSGVTCGGKSHLSQRLHQNIPGSRLLMQDNFFLDKNSEKLEIIPNLHHANWEVMSSLDYEAFLKSVQEIVNERSAVEHPVLILDGHLLLNSQPMVELLDRKYFLTLTKDQCWKRRSIRTYDPADVPGYFEQCVWPMYLKHKKEMEETVKDIVYLDGSLPKEEIYETVVRDLVTNLGLTISPDTSLHSN